MKPAMWVRALLVWLVIMVMETIHGILRNRFLLPLTGDFRSRQIGVLVASALILAITLMTIRWIGVRERRSLLAIGCVWAFLALAFEFTLGRAFGFSWQRIFEDYNLLRGGLMPLGMAVMILAPYLAVRLRD
jgi:hypothetical protein